MPNIPPIREPSHIRNACVRKLKAVKVSERFQAILGCILRTDWTTPRLTELVITADGQLLGRYDDQVPFEACLGGVTDLIHSIHDVASVAGLDGDEIGYMVALVAGIKRQQ